MGIRKYNPTTPGRRGATVSDFAELTPGAKPVKSLLRPKKQQGRTEQPGRDHRAGIAAAATSGILRLIDFRRNKDGIPAVVNSIQYDPEPHGADRPVALRRRREAIHPGAEGLKAGDQVLSGRDAPAAVGNCLPLSAIPLGMDVHSIEMQPGRGGVLCRSAGMQATLAARDADWAQINLPSGEIRRVPATCRATIGMIGNADHMGIVLGKAGPQALAGPPPARPRHGHEPHRPSARRRRRPHQGRPPPGQPHRQAGQGRLHPQTAKALEQGHRPAAEVAALRTVEDQ